MKHSLLFSVLLTVGCINFDDLQARVLDAGAGGTSDGGTSGGGTSGGGTSDGGTSGGSADAGPRLPDGGPFQLCDCVEACPSSCQFRDITSAVATTLGAGRIDALVQSNGVLFAAMSTSSNGRFVSFLLGRDGGQLVSSQVPFSGEFRDLDARFGVGLGLSSSTVAVMNGGAWRTSLPPADPLTGGVYQQQVGLTEAAVYLDEPPGVHGYSVLFDAGLEPLNIDLSRSASRARVRPDPAGHGYLLSQFVSDAGSRDSWWLYQISGSSDGGDTGVYFKHVEMSSSESQRTFVAGELDSELRMWHVTSSVPYPRLPTSFAHRITNLLNLNLRGTSTIDDADGGSTDLIVVEQSGSANWGFWVDGSFVPASNEWFVIVFRPAGPFLFRFGPANQVVAALTSPTSFVAAIECGTPMGSRVCATATTSQFVEVQF